MCDELLIKKAISGSRSAFEAIVAEYQPKIYSVCFRILKNEQDALDACQDAMIKIYLNLAKFKFKSSFSTWVYTVSRNTALDHIKKKKHLISIEELSDSGFEVPCYVTPESKTISADTIKSVSRMINSLSVDFRRCIILKDIDGYSIEDIAEIIGIPEGTVKSRLHRARAKLHEMIKKEGIEL